MYGLDAPVETPAGKQAVPMLLLAGMIAMAAVAIKYTHVEKRKWRKRYIRRRSR